MTRRDETGEEQQRFAADVLPVRKCRYPSVSDSLGRRLSLCLIPRRKPSDSFEPRTQRILLRRVHPRLLMSPSFSLFACVRFNALMHFRPGI